MTDHISTADTAKLIRAALKESFPGTKFSVTSKCYSGGSSINVRYQDGPAAKLVEQTISIFEGSYFDGMIDYKGVRYAKLDGKKVSFGGDFIFVNRDYSDAFIQRALNGLRARYPGNFSALGWEPGVSDFKNGSLYRVVLFKNGDRSAHNIQQLMHNLMAKMSDRAAPEKSATLARIEFAGDDGYGANTFGDLDKPEGQRLTNAGYPQPKQQKEPESAQIIPFPASGAVH